MKTEREQDELLQEFEQQSSLYDYDSEYYNDQYDFEWQDLSVNQKTIKPSPEEIKWQKEEERKPLHWLHTGTLEAPPTAMSIRIAGGGRIRLSRFNE